MNLQYVPETHPTIPGLKTSQKDGTQRLASSQVLSLLRVSVTDLESPVAESGVKTLRVDADFLFRKKEICQNLVTFCSARFPFCKALVFNHWGLLGSRAGYVQVTWEACFNVRVKTKVVQICQVRRQVHPSDVFDGGYFVIKLGRAKMLQTWKFSCDSPGVRKMTNNLVPKVNIFWRCLLRSQKKGVSFLLGRRWVYQILVLSGDDVAVVGKMDSTWFNLVVPFEPEEAGFTRWSSHWRNWQRFAVDELAAAYSCGYQVGSKHFDRGILHCWQHFQWKCGRSFGHYPPKNVSVFCVCLRTSWTNNTVRRISGGEDVSFLAFLRLNEAETVPKHLVAKHQHQQWFFCRWARQLNDTILPGTIFFRVEEVFAHNQSDRILLRYHRE